jgi:hypothetical protein
MPSRSSVFFISLTLTNVKFYAEEAEEVEEEIEKLKK